MKDKNGQELTSKELSEKVGNRLSTILREFEVFILHLVGYFPSHIVRKFFYIMTGVEIGSGSAIHMGARFYNPKNIIIGKDTIIGEDVVLDGRNKLRIGDHVDFATGVMVYNSQHDTASHDFH